MRILLRARRGGRHDVPKTPHPTVVDGALDVPQTPHPTVGDGALDVPKTLHPTVGDGALTSRRAENTGHFIG